jgi:hypothetical protein
MTHFLYRSQLSATSEFLDSRRFRKRCGLRRSRSQPSLDRPALTHKIAVTAYIASSDDSSRVNVHVLCGYLFSRASNTIDSFDPFNIFQANRLSANPALFHHLRVPQRLAWLLPWREMRCFESIVRRSCGRSQLAASRWRKC